MKSKNFLAICLSVVLAIGVIFSASVSAFADDVSFEFDEQTLVMTIKGSGAIDDYNENNMSSRPWIEYADATKKLVIEDGITHIGAYAFSRFSDLTEVEIPASVKSMGKACFSGNENLVSITVPSTVTEIADYAFGYNYQMDVSKGFVAYCESGSAAQKYCISKYIPFEAPLVNGEGKAFITEKAGQSIWSFIPKIDGELVFYSTGQKDTYGLIYDASNYVYIPNENPSETYKTMKNSALVYADDGGENLNFKITYPVTAGKRYYLSAKFALNTRYYGALNYSREDCSFDVRMSFNCTEHQYEIIDQKTPNCTEAGYEIYECVGCGDTYTSNIDSLGHTPMDPVEENRVEANCTEDGSYDEVVYCSVCNQEVSRTPNTIEKKGHSFTDYVSNNDATCTKDGTKTAKCDRCDATSTITDEGSAIGHHYTSNVVAPTCTAKGYTVHTCADCSDSYIDTYVDELGHSFTDYASNNDATCTEDGTKTAKCDRCDATDTKVDENTALGHEYVIFAFDGNVVTTKCIRDGAEQTLLFADYYNTKPTEQSAILDVNNDGFINAKDFAKIRNDLKKAQQ